jgi:hypothetical protein
VVWHGYWLMLKWIFGRSPGFSALQDGFVTARVEDSAREGGSFVLDLTAGSEETRERCESIQGRWGIDFLEAWQDRSE